MSLYQKIISENVDKGFQVRIVYNEFKDKEYIHIRKYFLSYEGEYIPSTEGISIPASISAVSNLFEGLLELLASAEGKKLIKEKLGELGE